MSACHLFVKWMLIAAVACCVSVFAQHEKKSEHNDSELTFTSRTELVLIPTLVADRSGVHITGLKKEDFTVLENGSERKISTFEEVSSDAQRLSRPVRPSEFSNALSSSGTTQRVTLIVLDLINTPFTDQAYARQELLKYLSRSLDPREPTGLFTLTRGGIHVIHDFTADPAVLQAALRKLTGDASHPVEALEDTDAVAGATTPNENDRPNPSSIQKEADKLQSLMREAELNFQSFQQRIAITYTLEGLQQLAHMLVGFPGRKSLIWAGGGFPFSVSDTTMQLAPAGRESLVDVMPLYERTWQLLNDAQIALYPVDVIGLQSTEASARVPVGREGKTYLRAVTWRRTDTQATLQTFAAATGGRAYYNSNDFVKGFRQAVQDSAQYYMLGYYLDRSDTKPGWRKLSVKVKRDHVEVRARSGFFVTGSTLDPKANRDSDIATALQSPLD